MSEIYKAAKEGGGDLLLVQNDYSQTVKMTSDTTFKLLDGITQPGEIDDITGIIAMEIILKKGRVVFTDKNELKGLAYVILKTSY